MPQPPRLPLSQVYLSGGKRMVRQGLLYALVAMPVLAVLLHWVDSHRFDPSWGDSSPDWSPWHSYAADLGPLPVVGMLIVAAAAFGASRARFGWGLLAALIACGVGFVGFFAAVLSHSMSNSEDNGAGSLYLLALFGVMLLGVVLLVVEPWAHVSTRTAMERAYHQQIPSARVLRR